MKHSEVISAIQEAVKETVNGKIDNMRDEFQDYVKGDLEWKKASQPAIDAMKDLTATKATLMSLAIFLTTIGGAIFIVYKLFTWKV